MALKIQIDQAGKPAGVTGFAREDLDLGVPVQLTATGGVAVTEYFWSWEYRPPNEAMTAPSAADFVSLTTNPTSFTPDNRGTYLIKLQVNQGHGLGATADDVAATTCYAGPSLNVDPKLLPRRRLAANERKHHNVPDILDPTGNRDGWAREWERWFRSVEHLWSLVGGLNDHGSLTGLGDDDHSQYLLGARPIAGQLGYVATATGVGTFSWQVPATGVTDHGLLSGLGDDDHVNYLRGPRVDSGGADLGKVPTGHADGTYSWQTPLTGVTDHGLLTGLGDDDHALYLPAARPASPGDNGKVLTAVAGVATWGAPAGGEVGWDSHVGGFIRAIKWTTPTSTSAEEYTGAELDGELGGKTSDHPFVPYMWVTSETGAYVLGSTITYTGTLGGVPASDVLTITSVDGGFGLTGVVSFDTITKIDVQAQATTGGAFNFGALWTGDYTLSVDINDYVQTTGNFEYLPVTLLVSGYVMHVDGCQFDIFTFEATWMVERISGVYSIYEMFVRDIPNIASGSDQLASGQKAIYDIRGFDSRGKAVLTITDLSGTSLTNVDAYELRSKGHQQVTAAACNGASDTIVTTVTSYFDWMAHCAAPIAPTISHTGSILQITMPIVEDFMATMACYIAGTYKVRPTYRSGVMVVG